MIKIVSVAQLRAVEAAADAGGLSYTELMDRAGRVIAFRVRALLDRIPTADRAVTILVGGGSNGGDGLTAARYIAESGGVLVRCYLTARREDDPLVGQARDAGVSLAYADDDQRYRVLTNMVASANIVIDALVGIGGELPLRDDTAKILRAVSAALKEGAPEAPLVAPIEMPGTPQRPYVLAVDCPSGLDCDTGEIDRTTLNADETLTFIAPKQGLVMFPGAETVGTLWVTSLGVPSTLPDLKAEQRFLVDGAYVRDRLPARPADAHKGSFGKLMIAGGSTAYMGAPALAAKGAYGVGAGLVAVAAPAPVAAALAPAVLEATWLPLPHTAIDGVEWLTAGSAGALAEAISGADAALIGCGMGNVDSTQALLRDLFGILAMQPDRTPPLILDADALNILSEWQNWWENAPQNRILTPHPGEMARLCGLTTAEVQANRFSLAAEKAAAWNCVVVLKGAHTLIAAPDGTLAVLPFKTAALAKAGTGDTLAGMIGGLLANGMNPFDAAVCGAYLHGTAGMRAAQMYGESAVLAGDLARLK